MSFTTFTTTMGKQAGIDELNSRFELIDSLMVRRQIFGMLGEQGTIAAYNSKFIGGAALYVPAGKSLNIKRLIWSLSTSNTSNTSLSFGVTAGGFSGVWMSRTYFNGQYDNQKHLSGINIAASSDNTGDYIMLLSGYLSNSSGSSITYYPESSFSIEYEFEDTCGTDYPFSFGA